MKGYRTYTQRASLTGVDTLLRFDATEAQQTPIHESVPPLDQVWAHKIVPWARSQRATRDRLMRKIVLRAVMTVVYFLVLVVGGRLADISAFPFVVGAWIGVGIFVWALWPFGEKAKQDLEAKKRVMGALCEEAKLDYDVDARSFDTTDFDTFSFQTKGASLEYRLEDHVAGDYAGLRFQLCEAQLVGKANGRTFYAFRGLLIRIPISKHFVGQTYVQPARERGFEGKIDYGAARLFTRGRWPETMRLEDLRFNQVFTVYTSDQIEGRYLLTPAMMERLVALSERAGDRRVECAFMNGAFLLALGAEDDMFEVKTLLDNPQSFAPVRRLQEEVSLVYELIDCLSISNKTRS